jgi:hypothetical protein
MRCMLCLLASLLAMAPELSRAQESSPSSSSGVGGPPPKPEVVKPPASPNRSSADPPPSSSTPAAPKPAPEAPLEKALDGAAALAPRASAQPPETSQAARPAAARVASERRSSEESILSAAQAFYTALLAKDVDRLATLSRAPFHFESRVANSPEEIKKRWASALSSQPLESLHLHDIEVLGPEEMVKKYGKPPERLAAWPMSGATLTVGNLSGHAAVVLWRKGGNGWQALAFHD